MRMKIFRNRRSSPTLAAALATLLAGSNLLAVDGPAVSSRPGARVARALPAAVGGGVPLSLNETISLALANNVDLNISVNTTEAARYSLMVSTGIFDPLLESTFLRAHQESRATSSLVGANVNIADTTSGNLRVTQLLPIGGFVSLGYAANRTATNSAFAFINPSYSSTPTASISQPLLRGFGVRTTKWLITISRNSRDSAYEDFVRSVQTVVSTVEQAYWDLVYAIENLEVKKESLRISQDLNRITKIKIDVGSLAPIDIVQTEVGIAQAEQDIILAEGLIGDAQDRVKRALNFDPARWSTPIVPTDKLQAEDMVTDLKVEEATQTALRKRPEVQSALLAVDSDSVRFDYWRNEALPGLLLVGSYGNPGIGGTTTNFDSNGNVISVIPGGYGDALSQMFRRDFKSWSVGFNVSYPILNRAGRGQMGMARYNLEASRARLATTEQNVLLDVRSAVRAIDTARRSIVAARKGRELAERNLDAERKKFENGMTTSFQVTQIQRDLSAARTNEEQALAVYRKAVSAFHYAMADILEWKGVQVEAPPEALRSEAELRKNSGQ
jgi:outer membrane protein